ncbi:type III PLP-dependent enzyme domain-containing protein [Algoriphagus yeomjeoni]|uniref:Diaminopimelate decarboxylase n=1 Tax=Algoriphagus yeomjeoni TaxID=291403 RepID=A0A327PNG6_9BACT|nr:Y4yA family PLP-dependent enzyme [Algoriphagus yeomjeoni]RAI93855.1 diaminopimelate decarboxylase [Algoriphagus yeomjeoni]
MARLPTLTPITSSWMHELMDERRVLNQLLEKHGSPINIHQTDLMQKNFELYLRVFEEEGLKNKLFFARKANKTKGVVRKAHALGMGIDTASYREYMQCLEMGIPASDLIVTAAVKNRELIEKVIKNGSLLVLDNEDECLQVQESAEELGKNANIAFRISGFIVRESKLYSRFGFDLETFGSFVDENFFNSNKFDHLIYKGLHFHLNGYSTEERSLALSQCLELSEQLSLKGFKTEFIDIGGGILMNYLKYETEWDNFSLQLRRAIINRRDPITFENQGLGLQVFGGSLLGELKTYPFWNYLFKGDFLRKILYHKNSSGITLAQHAKSLGVEIRMEPGRSMLDQVGLTVSRVAFRKKDSRGDWLVGLEMNMTQMLSGSADFMLDPFVLYQNEDAEGEAAEVYFTGAYCLERDVLLKRKIALQKLPQVGDLVIFVNTAGYMMHFFESSAHLFPLATNLIWNRSIENSKIDLAHFQNDDNH